jgi:hypothetical protein
MGGCFARKTNVLRKGNIGHTRSNNSAEWLVGGGVQKMVVSSQQNAMGG